MRYVVVFALVAMLASGCGEDDIGPETSAATTTPPVAATATPVPVADPVSTLSRIEDPASDDVPTVVAGANGFGFDLYRLLAAETTDNIVVSPVSVALAFAQVQAGATGPTATQLAEVFGYPEGEALHEAMNALARALDDANLEAVTEEDGEIVLEVANSAWGQRGLAFGQPFVDTLASHYGAGLRTVDFAGDVDQAIAQINAWAAEKTRGRIPEPVQSLPPQTVLAIVNAIYMKASWAFPFLPDRTTEDPFTTDAGEVVAAAMMRDERKADHLVSPDLVALRLPYVGYELSMTLLMPAGPLADFESDLDLETLDAVAANLEEARARLAIPKWDFENRVPLVDTLSRLGAPDLANLGGIAPGAAVGDAFQVANITVNEEGTEAAAVTVVAIATSSPPEPEVELVFDRPFVYVIRHEPTGAILFLGRVTDPS